MNWEDVVHGITGHVIAGWGAFLSLGMLLDEAMPAPRVLGGFLLVLVIHLTSGQRAWKKTFTLPEPRATRVN